MVALTDKSKQIVRRLANGDKFRQVSGTREVIIPKDLSLNGNYLKVESKSQFGTDDETLNLDSVVKKLETGDFEFLNK